MTFGLHQRTKEKNEDDYQINLNPPHSTTIPDLKIVSYSWLLDSIEEQKKKTEKDCQINLNKKRGRCPPPPVRSEKTPNKDKGEENHQERG